MNDVTASAPGRVNLIGEHTDYHEGFVMPCAIPQRTHVTLRRRSDSCVCATSAEQRGVTVEYALGRETRRGDWGDYVQGITVALRNVGVAVHGFELSVRSTVPVGSGLSSSAALEVALLRGLRRLFELVLSDVEIAQLGQRAEVDFVGAPVGIMDQMASSLASQREALFLDTRTLDYDRVPLPDTLDLLVIDSGVPHRHVGGGYVTRRRESAAAAEALGVGVLRDVDPSRLEEVNQLPEPLGRRARHVITENARVLEARDAVRAGDLTRFGILLNCSHASLRDDYDVSVPEVDLLVTLAQSSENVFGARMTGGGFGGAIVAAVRSGSGADVAERVLRGYTAATNRRATVLIPAAEESY
jgi:galactokinase